MKGTNERRMGLEEIGQETKRLAAVAEIIGDYVSAALLSGVAAHVAEQLRADGWPDSTCH